MTILRSLVFCRLVVGLALAGLLTPLVPSAEAHDATEARLAEVLGHAEAVQEALDATRHAADPLEAFVTAYALATGQDEDDVRSRLEGDALWLSTEIPTPHAVLATSGSAATTASRALTASLPGTVQIGEIEVPVQVVIPDVPVLVHVDRPRAHGARGP